MFAAPYCPRHIGGEVTKQEFVDQVAAESDLSKSDAGDAVDAFLTVIEEHPEARW